MLSKVAIQRIIPILRKDINRVRRKRVRGFPAVHFASFTVRDTHWFNTWASSGSVYRRRSDHTRNAGCDIRVGNARFDQVAEGGLRDEEERDSANFISMPIDDRSYDGLRMALWRLADAKLREALVDYKNREAGKVSGGDGGEGLPAFTPLRAITSIRHQRPEPVAEEWWVSFCKEMSRWMSELPFISSASVEFDANQQTKLFVSTERSTIVQHEQLFSLDAVLRRMRSDGTELEQRFVMNCSSQDELPSRAELKVILRERHENLMKMTRAKLIHSFSGPVLLYPDPAAVFFHETLGHRLEGSRLLSPAEGKTFRGLVGTRLLNIDLTVRDNPKLKSFHGRRCIGAYDYDDEGTPAQDTLLVRDGELVDFLNTRTPVTKRKHKPNGHARAAKSQRAVSRMAVTKFEGRHPVSMERLRQLFLEEIRRQGKPYGLIVYETTGGETETATYNFQAFSGEIAYATLVSADGKEFPVRGVNFVGTPLQALHNVVAVGDTLELHNDFCGAESGFIPISTISPAVLLSHLELQAKEESGLPPTILPRPVL